LIDRTIIPLGQVIYKSKKGQETANQSSCESEEKVFKSLQGEKEDRRYIEKRAKKRKKRFNLTPTFFFSFFFPSR